MDGDLRPGRCLRRVCGLLVLAVAAALGGCATHFVDGNQPEIPKAEYTQPAAPAAVQLVFEFQTRGVANSRATDFLRAKVQSQIADSGLFSNVTSGPAPGGALLSLTVNNVPLSDDAARKGFIAGLTFGLAGQTVGDGYDATLRYSPAAPETAPGAKLAKHVIYTNVGSAAPPPGAVKVASVEEAVLTMTRQVVSKLLSDLSKDPAFGKAPAAPTATAVSPSNPAAAP